MITKIKPIPDGFHTLTACLIVRGAANALAFYKKAFGATELMRLNMPDGNIAHSEFKIGDSIFMISDENPEWCSNSLDTLGGSPVILYLYVTDIYATFANAVKAGATEKIPLTNQFWGDRTALVIDPFGHHWHIASHIEDVDPNALQSRMTAFFAAQSA